MERREFLRALGIAAAGAATIRVSTGDSIAVAVGPWWEVLAPSSEILAIHGALLPNGRVLYFGGSQYVGVGTAHPTYQANVDSTREWDPVSGTVTNVGSPPRPVPWGCHDLFCSGHSFLPNGRLLVAGGWSDGNVPRNVGLRDVSIYDATTPTRWTTGPEMNKERGTTTDSGGRWYPTLVTLSHGDVAMMLGLPRPGDTRNNNTMVEVYDPVANTWTDQGAGSDVPVSTLGVVPTYPRLHLRPDGWVFCVTPLSGFCRVWDGTAKAWHPQLYGRPAASHEFDDWVKLSTSVMLPLRPQDDYRMRLLVVGGPQPQLLDLGQANPSWTNTAPRQLSAARYNCHAVLLPDGQVLVTGGSSDPHSSADSPVLQAELFNPMAGTWTTLESADVPRQYHSVALTLASGQVWTAGTNKNCQAGLAQRELRMEVFSPPNIRSGTRPSITHAPAQLQLTPGRSIIISTPQAATIGLVTLLRCGSTTHGFDADQRCIELQIVARTSTSVSVKIPPNTRIAPPGPYFLFVVNNGVPSVGRSIGIVAPPRVLAEPTTVAQTDGRVYVFWRGTNHSLWAREYVPVPNGWGPVQDLGTPSAHSSQVVGDPSAVVTTETSVNVFWKGTNGNLWHKWQAGGTWYGPQDLGAGVLGGPPRSLGRPDGTVNVFWRGGDSRLWHKWYDPIGGWQGHTSLGGTGTGALASDPWPVTSGPGVVNVFWKGANGNLWHKWQAGGTWHGPQDLGAGILGGPPTAVGHPGGIIDVFWRGGDDRLWKKTYFPAIGWAVLESMDGVGPAAMVSDPSPVIGQPGVVDVFWKGANGNLWHRWYIPGAGWYGPEDLGAGILGSGPHATGQSNGVIDVFWRGGDNQLWHKFHVGTWHPHEPFGGQHGD